MKNMQIITALTAIASCSLIAHAGLPNAHTWPMEHIMVSMDDTNTLHAHVNADVSNPVEMLRFEGEVYDGSAGVLNDQYYSDQFGWVLDGIVDPGFGNSIWIEMDSQSDGLSTYEGGRRMMIDVQTFNPIFGTDGSDAAWQWSGMMTHHWYSAATLGDFQATYNIFVGDSSGNAIAGYGAASVTLNLRSVPTPASMALLGLGSLTITRRKRG